MDHRRRGLRLQWITIGWNLLEVVVTVVLGVAAHSLALIAFGMDSLVEVFASLVVVWEMGGPGGGDMGAASGAAGAPLRRRRALTLVAVAFAVLALYLVAGSADAILARGRSDSSPWGIAYLAVTAVVMFTLAWRKRLVGAALASDPFLAEARMTFLDGCLATAIVGALAVRAALGWWWADPAAAALVAVAAAGEARSNWHEARALASS